MVLFLLGYGQINAALTPRRRRDLAHKNILGRTEMVVGVAYGTDPRLIRSVLLDCAKAHPNVMSKPQPFVLFIEFADGSLNFELRAYLSNVGNRVQTSSDIRFVVHDALKENCIEVPFPQRVVHMGAPPPPRDGGP